jgi:hypothetical protein
VIENSDLFDAYPDLYDEPSYDIQSDVDLEDCACFVDFLQSRDESLVTSDNCRALRELAAEFGDRYLLELCEQLQTAAESENVIVRLLAVEELVSQQCEECENLGRDLPQALCEFVVAKLLRLSEAVRDLRKETDERISALASKLASDRSELEQTIREVKFETREGLEAVRESIQDLERTTEYHHLWSLAKVECPMERDRACDGIIAYLMHKYGGNVYDGGIVQITSKSVGDPCYPPNRLADSRPSRFVSKNEPGQWLSWDFGEMRVFPTHYTINCPCGPKSWIVEASLDGRNWTEIDRKTNDQSLKDFRGNQASFAVVNAAHFRFIRLTQTDKRHGGDDVLLLSRVDFFGTLSEYKL